MLLVGVRMLPERGRNPTDTSVPLLWGIDTFMSLKHVKYRPQVDVLHFQEVFHLQFALCNRCFTGGALLPSCGYKLLLHRLHYDVMSFNKRF